MGVQPTARQVVLCIPSPYLQIMSMQQEGQ